MLQWALMTTKRKRRTATLTEAWMSRCMFAFAQRGQQICPLCVLLGKATPTRNMFEKVAIHYQAYDLQAASHRYQHLWTTLQQASAIVLSEGCFTYPDDLGHMPIKGSPPSSFGNISSTGEKQHHRLANSLEERTLCRETIWEI